MEEFWVPASRALSIVAEASDNYSARLAICSRANAGMLRSKASVLITEEKRSEEIEVPREFWWADGHDALEQDWARGDFSTWIDRRYEWKAFGVQFDFSGLQQMMPPTTAAAAARKLSVVTDRDWLSAREARKTVWEKTGVNPKIANEALLNYCTLGFVPARAVRMERRVSNQNTVHVREWDVPAQVWRDFADAGETTQNWELGDFTAIGSLRGGARFFVSLSGVHFEAGAILELGSRESKQERGKNPGGRPPKDWWDDLWCAVWGEIVHGELTPKNQA
jgi:hypothetical protein